MVGRGKEAIAHAPGRRAVWGVSSAKEWKNQTKLVLKQLRLLLLADVNKVSAWSLNWV